MAFLDIFKKRQPKPGASISLGSNMQAGSPIATMNKAGQLQAIQRAASTPSSLGTMKGGVLQGSSPNLQGSNMPLQGSNLPLQGSNRPIQGGPAPLQGGGVMPNTPKASQAQLNAIKGRITMTPAGTPNAGSGGGNNQVSTGGGNSQTPPPATDTNYGYADLPAPTEPKVEAKSQLDIIAEKVRKGMEISPEEEETQKRLNNLISSKEMGLAAVADQPIAMDFITGQQAAIERRAATQSIPLSQQLALMQAKRAASMDVSKTELEIEKVRRSGEQAKGVLTEISDGMGGTRKVLIDPATGRQIADVGGAPISAADAKTQAADMKGKEQSLSLATDALNAFNTLANHPGKSAAIGIGFGKAMGALPGIPDVIPGTARAGFLTQLDRAKALLALPNLTFLKGLGAMSDREFSTIQASVGALSPNMSQQEFDTEIARIQQALAGTITKINSGSTAMSGGGDFTW